MVVPASWGGSLRRQRRGVVPTAMEEGLSLSATHKNQQTDPLAKIIHVGQTYQDYLFLEPSGIKDQVIPQR